MLIPFEGKMPRLDPTAFVAGNALVIGDVEIGPEANIWFHCIVRGDVNYIRIGPGCNIQDACVLHVEKDGHALVLDEDVALGHKVVVHGCRIKKQSLIGIGAIVLNGAEIGEESIVGAGALVTPGTVIPPRTLALGSPARPVRALTGKDLDLIRRTLANYRDLKEVYRSIPGV
jgi:gamma-carbonic anhydrase